MYLIDLAEFVQAIFWIMIFGVKKLVRSLQIDLQIWREKKPAGKFKLPNQHLQKKIIIFCEIQIGKISQVTHVEQIVQDLQILFCLRNRNMFIKNAVVTASKMIIGQKKFAELTSEFLVQIVFLTSIKNYLNAKASAEQKFFIIPEDVRKKSQKKKHILVLDMDQTLVYTRRPTKPTHSNYIFTQCDGQDMYIQPRPFARQFLISVKQIFTVYVYTAGKKKYADTVLDKLDPMGAIEKRFYRDSCRKVNGNVIKDLRYLKKTLKQKKDMILVDDNTDSIRHNYPFSVKIEAYEGNQEDLHLKNTFQTLLRFYH